MAKQNIDRAAVAKGYEPNERTTRSLEIAHEEAGRAGLTLPAEGNTR